MSLEKKIFAPKNCDQCGGQVRMTHLEPHPTNSKTDVLTFECQKCHVITVVNVPVGEYFGPAAGG